MKESNPDKKPVRRSTNKEMVSEAPKFKFMWLAAIVMVTLLLGKAFISWSASKKKEIVQQRFLNQMLKNHDVDQLQAYMSGNVIHVDVFIKPASLNKPEYSDLSNNKGDINTPQPANQPQCFFFINSFSNLETSVNKVANNFPEGPPPLKFINREGVWDYFFTKVLK